MSVGVSAIPGPPTVKPDVNRRSANYHPSIWGDHFLSYASDFMMLPSAKTEQVEALNEEVRRMLAANIDNPSSKLNLIDVILRLGIGYYFEDEIDQELEQVYNTYQNYYEDDGDLGTVALRFRLLRQHGYNVSSDIFNKFKDGEGKFKENLANEAKGLLNLYEASYLSVHGEDILDEALAFTKTHLKSMVTQLVSPLADQVSHALNRSLHRGIVKYEQWYSISIYEQDELHIKPLLKLAKLNFNMLQKLYQEELSNLSKWWKDLDFTTKLPFARDRLIECYLVVLGLFVEPQHALARQILTKSTMLVSILDDIYDVHGTIEELEQFTKMIERWDTSMENLPDYMKVWFEALLAALSEIEEETTKEGRSYCVSYAREAEENQVRSYIAEARWFNEDYVPTLEEYRKNGVFSCTYPMLTVSSLCGMGKIASKEVFDWLFTHPKILVSTSDLFRLIDDVASHEFEQERGHVASSVECYMRQYGVSKQEAHDELKKLVESDWKDINEEYLKPLAVPKKVLQVFLNFARVADVFYRDYDAFTESRTMTKDMLAALLVNPMTI